MKTTNTYGILAAVAFWSLPALGFDSINRPFLSARDAGMGGVKMTTGLYEANFYGNPALVTQNPKWKVTILDLMTETNSKAVSTAQDMISDDSEDMLKKISGTAGNNNHVRVQTAFPAVYLPNVGWKLSFAFAVLMQTNADLSLRRSFLLDPAMIADVGPALTVGRTFLSNNALSVGLNTHFSYRLASKSGFSLVDLIKGMSLSPAKNGGEAARIDFDLGARYQLPWKWKEFEFSTGAVINNIIAGDYNVDLQIANTDYKPDPINRSLSVGVSARRPTWWKLRDTVFALDVSDMGNNANGSIFRLVHIGAETNWSVFALRGGVNQGYLTAGLGINLKVMQLDFATYSEELSLNVGGYEDRRYAARLTFQI